MSSLGDRLEKCWENGGVNLRKLMEIASVRFDDLSLDDVRFIESECRELREKFELADKVDCFKTYRLLSIGFNDYCYFRADEQDKVKELAKIEIEKGNFNFKIENVKVSKLVLDGFIKDRNEWENF